MAYVKLDTRYPHRSSATGSIQCDGFGADMGYLCRRVCGDYVLSRTKFVEVALLHTMTRVACGYNGIAFIPYSPIAMICSIPVLSATSTGRQMIFRKYNFIDS